MLSVDVAPCPYCDLNSGDVRRSSDGGLECCCPECGPVPVDADDLAAFTLDEHWLHRKLRAALDIQSDGGSSQLAPSAWMLGVAGKVPVVLTRDIRRLWREPGLLDRVRVNNGPVRVIAPTRQIAVGVPIDAGVQGLDFLAEDAVFVQPDSLLATGVANYVHVQVDALRFVDDEEIRRWIGQAPLIRRRSGVEKFEADLRQGPGRLAAAPLQLAGAVFFSGRPADNPDILLSPIPRDEIAARLAADQPYAAGQPGWHRFEQQLARQGVHQLRRGRHPRAAVDALRQLLD